MKKMMLVMSVFFMVFLVLGCTPQQAAEMQDDTADDSSDAAQDNEQESMDEGQPEEDASADAGIFSSFIQKKNALTFTVEYDVKTTAQSRTTDTTMTLAMQGPSKVRTETETQGMQTFSLVLDDMFYSCTVINGQDMCYKGAIQESESANIESNPSEYAVVKAPSKVIAGVTAECFSVTSQDVTALYCYSPEGVPLYTRMENSGVQSEMTATSYSLTADAALFVAPANAQDLPTA
ncbi:hypothetical protein C4573_02250 [Candidatus Woesearchaeota archaeon]|nr:MAG: hypothetical protein C4573_02250 [Candidatus Woesearchaeota archaeon]